MCGIAGLFSKSSDQNIEEILSRALSRIAHRGPDGEFSIIRRTNFGTLGLGHRRLAIIDLSSHGRQPMTSASGRFTITFNGEIYNYKELGAELRAQGVQLRTETDTEVLLEAWALWGAASLSRLTGMFAFVIEDRETNTLDCVRDAFGIKPLFYAHGSSSFCFASEIGALRELAPGLCRPNAQRAFDFLSLGRYDDKVETFFEGVSQLEPGCRLTVQLGEKVALKSERWWWPSIREREGLGFADAVDEVRSQFLANVRLHLRSDVPLGAALSGGVDSSSLVCAMRHLEPEMDIHTFSYIAATGAVNEESWVDTVNAHVGGLPHKVSIKNADLSTDLDDLISIHGEPFGSTSIYAGYRIFKSVREAGVVVCLDGQGADEMFAGYHGYPEARLLTLLEGGRLVEMATFLSNWSKWPGRRRSAALQMLASDLMPPFLQGWARDFVGRTVIKPWMKADVLQRAGVRMQPYSVCSRSWAGRGRRLAEIERSLLTGGGLAHLLRHGDRNSMRWSVESRVPFLTTDLAELALSLPENYLISPTGETKSIFRAAMRGIVPDGLLDRRDKVGFETPELHWLNAQSFDINSILEPAAELDFLDVDQLKLEVIAILSGTAPFSWQAWRILNYCRWAGIVLFN